MKKPKNNILTKDDVCVSHHAGRMKSQSMPPGAACMTTTGSSRQKETIQSKTDEVTPDKDPTPVPIGSGANEYKTVVDVCQVLELDEEKYTEILARNTIL